MEVKAKTTQFSGLNFLRFLAAFVIVIHHTEQHKHWIGASNSWGTPFIDNLGQVSVTFFFVLSGFLITFQLLNEQVETGTISWKKFQSKRALRLWPVYFFVVLIAFFVLPHLMDLPVADNATDQPFGKLLILYLLFLPNLARLLAPVFGVYQFWYIGVQEQFYWIWPLVMKNLRKYLVAFLLGIILMKWIGEVAIISWVNQTAGQGNLGLQVLQFWKLFQIEQLAIGALGAYFFHRKEELFLNLLISRRIFAGSLLVFTVLFFVQPSFPGFKSLQALLILLLILNVAFTPSISEKVEGPFFDKLGSLSFGIYAYHTIVIGIAISILGKWDWIMQSPLYFNALLYFVSISFTLLLSSLSYQYLEGYFLTLKKKIRQPEESNQRHPFGKPSQVA